MRYNEKEREGNNSVWKKWWPNAGVDELHWEKESNRYRVAWEEMHCQIYIEGSLHSPTKTAHGHTINYALSNALHMYLCVRKGKHWDKQFFKHAVVIS